MADKLDRIIGDYTNGRIDMHIRSIESRYIYKQKVGNLGIRTAYFTGSQQERHLLNQEKIEEDNDLNNLKQIVQQFNSLFQTLTSDEKRVIELKSRGYGGLYWYQVEMELELENIDIRMKKAKRIYFNFKKELQSFLRDLI